MAGETEYEKENGAPSTSTRNRRPSLVEIIASRPSMEGSSINRAEAIPTSGSAMASALSQAQQQPRARRLSITTLGLSGAASQSQTSPFGSLRRGSSANDVVRPSIDENESAIDDSDNAPAGDGTSSKGEAPGGGNGSISPLGRRFSFGARAYGDSRTNGPSERNTTGGMPGSLIGASPGKNSSPPGLKSKDGFSWSESLRTRAERGSLSAAAPVGPGTFSVSHNRSRSMATTAEPVSIPAAKTVPTAPDHFQERILKGDFYMD